MSWNRIVLPLTMTICPETVQIGKLAQEVYQKENKPEGFAMFHATCGNGRDESEDKRIVYFSPVAASLCTEILEQYSGETCDVPARDEPNMAFVFGDPLVMGYLKDSVN